jgi:hypothetical protein
VLCAFEQHRWLVRIVVLSAKNITTKLNLIIFHRQKR